MQTDTRNGIRTPHNDNGRVGTGALTASSPKTGGVFPPLPVPPGGRRGGRVRPHGLQASAPAKDAVAPLGMRLPRKRGTETRPAGRPPCAIPRQTPSRPLACSHPRQVADRNASRRPPPSELFPRPDGAHSCPDSVPLIERLAAPFDFRAAFKIAISDLRESNPIRCNAATPCSVKARKR